jgi:DNA polymerase III delta prime subunit
METIQTWNNINTILDRESIKENIKSILFDFKTKCNDIHFKKGIYIYGTPGCGKTLFIKNILKEIDFDSICYDAGDIRNKSLIDTITSNNISNYNVLTMMQKKQKQIAIIMDEIDGMNNGDKGGIAALIKLIRQKKTKKQQLENVTLNPIICIGNHYSDKKIKELMKVCNVFELKTPNDNQIESFLYKIVPNLSHLFKKLISFIQGDLRKFQFIDKIKNIDSSIINEDFFDKILLTKSYNEDSKNITTHLFENYVPIEKHNTFINENDRTIVSLLYHENISDHMKLNKFKNTTKTYLKILENICYSDYIDRITFQNQIWQFNEMSSIIKTLYSNYIYHNEIPNQNKLTSEIRFTKVLTKYSTEYNNQQFIFNMCQELNLDKKDLMAFFYHINNIFNENMFDNNEFIENLLDNSNINKLDIKRIFKFINKISKRESSKDYLSDNE